MRYKPYLKDPQYLVSLAVTAQERLQKRDIGAAFDIYLRLANLHKELGDKHAARVWNKAARDFVLP